LAQQDDAEIETGTNEAFGNLGDNIANTLNLDDVVDNVVEEVTDATPLDEIFNNETVQNVIDDGTVDSDDLVDALTDGLGDDA
jgi:hypothetical protein